MVERSLSMREVRGSIPCTSKDFFKRLFCMFGTSMEDAFSYFCNIFVSSVKVCGMYFLTIMMLSCVW